ncbi:Leucine-rich repeat-containing N-terminal [Trypanosoma melophagium]|uniref:Leucine-rich repeat-containing N-terminal n=1 Tax=Trypanosoma melophagium TaxID=715481 RepID=UPI00351A8558|nr:Leucine-rich repeat-containing N-terminal [Trypanosoma melophagium]
MYFKREHEARGSAHVYLYDFPYFMRLTFFIFLLCCSYALVCSGAETVALPVPSADGPYFSRNNRDNHCSTYHFLKKLRSKLRPLSNIWRGDSYCQWTGVTCENMFEGTGVRVDLRGMGLRGKLPKLDDCETGPSVVYMDLSNNPEVVGRFPPSWAVLKRLEILRLGWTSLNGAIPDSWNGMTSLREIVVRGTAACMGLPHWNRRYMPFLTKMDFSYNNMNGPLSSSLSTFADTLTEVSFVGNKFCGCIPVTWPSSSNLYKAIKLANPSLSTTPPCLKCHSIMEGCFSGPNPGDSPVSSPTTLPPSTTPGSGSSAADGANDSDGDGASAPLSSHTRLFLLGFTKSIPQLQWSLLSPDYCTWPGVSCSQEESTTIAKAVSSGKAAGSALPPAEVHLDLRGMGLQGTCPEVDPNVDPSLVKVVSLDMSDNAGLYGPLCSSWSALSQLRSLNLTRTGFSGSIPNSWVAGFGALQNLGLSSMRLCGSLPDWSALNKPALNTIDLSNNYFRGTLSSTFATLANTGSLVNFSLENNMFCGCLPSSWMKSTVLIAAAEQANPLLVTYGCAATNVCIASECNNATFPGIQMVELQPSWVQKHWWLFLILFILALLALVGCGSYIYRRRSKSKRVEKKKYEMHYRENDLDFGISSHDLDDPMKLHRGENSSNDAMLTREYTRVTPPHLRHQDVYREQHVQYQQDRSPHYQNGQVGQERYLGAFTSDGGRRTMTPPFTQTRADASQFSPPRSTTGTPAEVRITNPPDVRLRAAAVNEKDEWSGADLETSPAAAAIRGETREASHSSANMRKTGMENQCSLNSIAASESRDEDVDLKKPSRDVSATTAGKQEATALVLPTAPPVSEMGSPTLGVAPNQSPVFQAIPQTVAVGRELSSTPPSAANKDVKESAEKDDDHDTLSKYF